MTDIRLCDYKIAYSECWIVTDIFTDVNDMSDNIVAENSGKH